MSARVPTRIDFRDRVRYPDQEIKDYWQDTMPWKYMGLDAGFLAFERPGFKRLRVPLSNVGSIHDEEAKAETGKATK